MVNSFKLDPQNLCPPVIDTNFFDAIASVKENLLNMDQITIANEKYVVAKRGGKETSIVDINPTAEFIENPCSFQPHNTDFFSPEDYSHLSMAMDQSQEQGPIVFRIEYDDITQSFSNEGKNLFVNSADQPSDISLDLNIPDPTSPAPNPKTDLTQRYGCLYEDKSFSVCPKNYVATKAFCSGKSRDTREKRRLTNRLDSLILNSETTLDNAVSRLEKILVAKENFTVKDNILIAPKIDNDKEIHCLPLKIRVHPTRPAPYTDALVSSDEYVDLEAYIRTVSDYLKALEVNVQLLEHDDYGVDLQLYQPVRHVADYLLRLFHPDIIMFTGPAAAVALITLLACCCGMLRCLQPRIAEHHRNNSRITMRSLAFQQETRPLASPPSYEVGSV